MLNFRLNQWGSWSARDRFVLETQDKYDLRKDLTGVHLEAATEQHVPFSKIESVTKQSLPRGYIVS